MALTLLLVGLVVAVIIEATFIRVRLVTVLFLIRLFSMGSFVALFLSAVLLSATALVDIGPLVASVHEICSSTEVHWEVYNLLCYHFILSVTGSSLYASRINFG